MTQPTQEDLERIFINILKFKNKKQDLITWVYDPIKERWVNIISLNPADDSFTGALVKAVFPLLAERNWFIVPYKDGKIQIFEREYKARQGDPIITLILTAPNLNTALIEAWKKIEGEKK